MAECRSCHAEIDWAQDAAGKRIPVDPGERADGNLAVQPGGPPGKPSGTFHVRYLRKDGVLTIHERRTVSHYVTCPHAKEWRDRGTAINNAERRGTEAAYEVLGMFGG